MTLAQRVLETRLDGPLRKGLSFEQLYREAEREVFAKNARGYRGCGIRL